MLPTAILRKKECVCCGIPLAKNKNKYCSKDCREDFVFRLKWFNNLLRAINARYAIFSFDRNYLFLHILINMEDDVYSYFYSRTIGKRPIYDMEKMVFSLGEIWWGFLKSTKNIDGANREVLNIARKKVVGRLQVVPKQKINIFGVSKELTILKIDVKELKNSSDPYQLVKKAYKRALFKSHPDTGGEEKTFIKVYNAYQRIILWLKDPKFLRQKGVPGFWAYEAQRENWYSPL